MKRFQVVILLLVSLSMPFAVAGDRVPGESWMAYADPAEAGFDAEKLTEARAVWEQLPSSAFMVIADGAVVASWGDVERRFMCHSVRKSFLSALYGIYWDRGEIKLNRTMEEIGIEEPDDPLLPRELQARTLDLLKAKSGVFHPAAYAGRTDSRPRGSEGPGQYFAYNNWDFNTLAAILEKETGASVFKAFDEHFGAPLEMQDWRLSDGYFHYERDKSQYPAYPFRMSARDAARFGLLFAREGRWDDQQILSRHWVRRSTALYSIDSGVFGYGFMWWIAREPRFAKHGFAAALGVGNQMIATLPDSDIVIVNRANTYQGDRTPTPELLDLIEKVLDARTVDVAEEPKLVPLQTGESANWETHVPSEQLSDMVGEWPYPAPVLGAPPRTSVTITAEYGHLVTYSEVSGTFKTYLQPDGWLIEEDSGERYLPMRNQDGSFSGIADARSIASSALLAAAGGDKRAARRRMALVENETGPFFAATTVALDLINGKKKVDESARAAASRFDPMALGRVLNRIGYTLMGAEHLANAEKVFRLNTRLWPELPNPWDSLGVCLMEQERYAESITAFERVLELDPENPIVREQIATLRAKLK
jgi:CubicO group peptidase (beta-lactamase class C family)